MLGKRLITSLLAFPLVFATVWFDEPISWLTVLGAVIGLLAIVEFFQMTGVTKTKPLAICGILLTLLVVISPNLQSELDFPLLPLLLAAAVVLPLVIIIFLPKKEGLYRSWAWILAGVLYIGWLLSFLVDLRLVPDAAGFPDTGRNLVFMALFVTFGSDTLAYFVGKAIGRHKMAPSISPGKTWEGAVGGIIGAVIVGLLFIFNTPFQLPMDFILTLILAVLISIFGQLGDLAESVLKRGTGVKDSGVIMPGHGGMLDRLDSILFAGVVVYWFYMFWG